MVPSDAVVIASSTSYVWSRPERRPIEAEIVPGERVLGLAAGGFAGVVMHVLEPDQPTCEAQVCVVDAPNEAQRGRRAGVGGVDLDCALRDAHLDVVQSA